jgi:hypothetical protein
MGFRACRANYKRMKLYRIRLVSATSEKWLCKYAINEVAAKCMVYQGKRWKIDHIEEIK